MMSISKKYEAHAKIKLKIHSMPIELSCKLAESICGALRPKIESLNCCEKIEIKSPDTNVFMYIHTKNAASLRAVFGSFMWLLQTAYGCLRT